MDLDIAGQFERLVAVFQANPWTSFLVLLAILLILAFQKDGLLSKVLSLIEARSVQHSEKEERRMEIMRMLERRQQPLLPYSKDKQKEDEQ